MSNSIDNERSRLVWYFAYGSNLHMQQMRNRVGDWKDARKAHLNGWKLVFTVLSTRWGGGAANIARTDDPSHVVYGASYLITPTQLATLTGYEGVPPQTIRAVTEEGEVQAKAYIFKQDKPPLIPQSAYIATILQGLKDHGHPFDVLLDFKLSCFPDDYMVHFDDFWKWKLKVESTGHHILDDTNWTESYRKLCYILPRWQTYRGSPNPHPLTTLKTALREIAGAYEQIRGYSLLQFGDIPNEPLRLIWNELGRVKEYEGKKNDPERYQVISICKPLMIIWGQTLAFDSHVRANSPDFVPRMKSAWSFEEWKIIMNRFMEMLKQDPDAPDFIRRKSEEKYQNASVIPYGRFLDIYYF